jgi:hypothetical protein
LSNATTGSERVIPDQPLPAGETGPGLARLARPLATHWQFTVVALGAILVRLIVMLGYPPIFWFNDSYNYIYDAVTHIPDEVRPNGYPFLLDLLMPLHSLDAVSALQAAMGLAMGIGTYAVLRHRGLPWWGATLPTLPVFFDSYELHLEHMVNADTFFTFLVTFAIIVLCWSDRPSVLVMGITGLMIGYGTLVRSVGQPLLAVVFVAMLIRWVGWRRLLTFLVAGIVPVAAYMFWFHDSYGKYALTESRGAFLYSRVSTFAECSKINPPSDLRVLCDWTPTSLRPVSGEYIWADNELGRDSRKTTPLYNLTHSTNTALRFTPSVDKLTEKFAEDAILAQPVAYARVVVDDTLRTFDWNREPDPQNYYGNGPAFQFVGQKELNDLIPWWAGPDKSDAQAMTIYQGRQEFGGSGLGNTTATGPWAHLLQMYQRYIYLRGTMLAIIVLIGAAGVLARWRRWGGIALLPWLVGALLIVLPPMTAGFSYRYVLAAVPTACLAAGLAFARMPGERSAGALASGLRRHLGRGVAVDQE